LPWGTYEVKEIKAPLGYKLSDKTQSVTINSTDVTHVQNLIFNDTQILGKLSIIKTGKDWVKLQGAEFTVTGPNGFNKTVTTNEEGVATLSNLPWGTYIVKETKAPKGYNLNKTIKIVQVTNASVGQIQSLTFNDTQILGNLNITKLGKNGAKLEGAQFTISSSNGFNETVTTNKDGVASLSNLPWGTYRIKETKAPLGYKLNDKLQTITINSSDVSQIQSLTFNDNQILGKLRIIKTGKDGIRLEGAKFNITGPNRFNKIVTTNKNGFAILDNLQWGTYSIKEIEAPQGYNLNDKVQTIQFTSESVGKIQSLTFKDTQILGNLTITKIGKDGVKLEGAKFKVTGPNGFNEIVTTNIDGIAILDNLQWGTYSIKEVKAPQNYSLNNKIFNVTINSKDAYQFLSIKDKLNSTNTITSYNNKNNKIENVDAKNSSKTNIENNNSQSNTESPKTGDTSELPLIILLGFAIATLILINRRKILNNKK
uniref:MSCRAMM family protein n=1 Tax=Clostridium thermobutyricum TaxID=29372 RepID=UPI00243568FF